MKAFKYVFLVLLFVGCQSDYESAIKSFEQHNFKEAKKSFAKVPEEDSLYSKAQEFIALCNNSILADSAKTLLDKAYSEIEKGNHEGALILFQALPEEDFLKYNIKKEYVILHCKGAIEYKRKNYKLASSYLSKIPKEDTDDDYYSEVKKLADLAKEKIQLWRKDSSMVMSIINKEFQYSEMFEEQKRDAEKAAYLPNTEQGELLQVSFIVRVHENLIKINRKIKGLTIPTEISNDSVKILLEQSKKYLQEAVDAKRNSFYLFLEHLQTQSMAKLNESAREGQTSDSLNYLFINYYKKTKNFYTAKSDEDETPIKAIPSKDVEKLKKKYGY